MITVHEALAHITAHAKDFGMEEVSLMQTTKRTLAQDVIADRDFPPYHRVTMDGIAINAEVFNADKKIFFYRKHSSCRRAFASFTRSA